MRYATEHGFCTWPAVDRDPLWVSLRQDPEFRRLREEGIACRERFIEATGIDAAS